MTLYPGNDALMDLTSSMHCTEDDPLGLCRRPVQVSLEKGLQVESGDHDVVEQPEIRPDRRAHLLPRLGCHSIEKNLA